jgi:hypothetical protein
MLFLKLIQIKIIENLRFYVPIFCFLCDQFLANCKKLRFYLKKLVVPQLLKIFFEFLQKPKFLYRIHRSPTVVPILCQINPDCVFTTDIRSILILFFHLGLGLLSDLFSSYFFTKTLYSSLASHCVLYASPISFFLFIAWTLCGEGCTNHESLHFCGQALPLFFNAIVVTAERDRTVMAAVLKMRIWKQAVEPVWCWYHLNCVRRLGRREWDFAHFAPPCQCCFRRQAYWWNVKTRSP